MAAFLIPCQIQDQGRGAKDYEDFAMDNLEAIELATNTLLSKGTKDDTPTGGTPRKRKWQYTEAWSLTKSRDELLSHRKQHRPGSADVDMQDANTDEVKTVVSD